MKSVLPALALASTLPFSLAACVVVDSQGHITHEEKRFTVSGTPDLRLTTFDGAIEIRSGDAKTVVVEIEKRGPTQESIDATEGRDQAGRRPHRDRSEEADARSGVLRRRDACRRTRS